jgi:hypothetical protein
MEFDSRDARMLADAVAAPQGACGERLLAIALTGEAASIGYRPRGIAPAAPSSATNSLTTPMVLDPLYLETSLDVFPL